MHENGPVLRGRDDEAKLTANHHAHDLFGMAGENSAGRRIIVGRRARRKIFVDDEPAHAVPYPDHDGRVARARRHEAVTVRRLLGPIHARDEVVVAVHDLADLARVGREDSVALVEEARRNQESKRVFIRIYFKFTILERASVNSTK